MASPLIAGALFTLTPAKPVFEIGEPVWLRIQIQNRGADVFDATSHTRFGDRGPEGLQVWVTGPDGEPCPDPWRFMGRKEVGGSTADLVVAPGDDGEFRFDLSKHAWLDRPGT